MRTRPTSPTAPAPPPTKSCSLLRPSSGSARSPTCCRTMPTLTAKAADSGRPRLPSSLRPARLELCGPAMALGGGSRCWTWQALLGRTGRLKTLLANRRGGSDVQAEAGARESKGSDSGPLPGRRRNERPGCRYGRTVGIGRRPIGRGGESRLRRAGLEPVGACSPGRHFTSDVGDRPAGQARASSDGLEARPSTGADAFNGTDSPTGSGVTMVGELAICARDLVLAVFRLAVADYLGVCYGHDEPGPNKRTKGSSKPKVPTSS